MSSNKVKNDAIFIRGIKAIPEVLYGHSFIRFAERFDQHLLSKFEICKSIFRIAIKV